MTSSVGHMRQALSLNIFQEILNGDLIEKRLLHITELCQELSPSDSDSFVQHCDLLFLGKRHSGGMGIGICEFGSVQRLCLIESSYLTYNALSFRGYSFLYGMYARLTGR